MRTARATLLLALFCLAVSSCLLWSAKRDGTACSTENTCPPGQRCSGDGQCLYPCPVSSCRDSECGCRGIDRDYLDSNSSGFGFTCESDGLCHYTCQNQGGPEGSGSCPGYMNCQLATMLCLPACTGPEQCANGASCVPVPGGNDGAGVSTNYCVGNGPVGDGGVDDAWSPDGSSPDSSSHGDAGCAPNCPASGVYPIVVDQYGLNMNLFVDNDTDGGGWILVGQVGGVEGMPASWLKSMERGSDLQDPIIKSGTWACIDATWLAVERATEIRISNSDRSRWMKWSLPAGRTVDTWWDHSAGQADISSATESTVVVTRWDGTLTDCYQNIYGINPLMEHGGSYPAVTASDNGTTSGGDWCMTVGVLSSGQYADGFNQNGNGYDAPKDEADWPNANLGQGPWVNVWLR
jgi:hypothetical protein